MPAAIILGVAAASGLTAAVGGAIGAAIVGSAVTATTAMAIGTGVISGGITAAKGGKASDVLRSAVLGGITAGAGSAIASSVASDIAFNAIASGVGGKTAVIIGNALGGAAAGAISGGTSAILRGQDPIEALIRGGLTSGLAAGVDASLYEITKNIPMLSQPTGSAAGDAIQRATNAAIATSILGGSAKDALKESVLSSFANIAANYIGNAIQDNSAKLRADSEAVKAVGNEIQLNEEKQKSTIQDFNNLVTDLNNSYSTVTGKKSIYEHYLKDPQGLATYFPEKHQELLNNSILAYNKAVEDHNNLYEQKKPVLDGYQNTINTLQAQLPELEKIYTAKANSLNGSITEFQAQEAKNAALALKAIEDVAVAKEIYKSDTGRDITDDELKRFAGLGSDLVKSVDSAYTSEGEAKEIWRNFTGSEPSEFDLMELVGLDEKTAASLTENRSNTTTEEAENFLKSLYGADYKPTTDQLMELIGRPERAAESFANNIYVTDKNETTESEAIDLLKSAGLKESDLTPDQIKSVVGAPEKAVTNFFQYLAVERQLYFDGGEYERQIDAQNKATEMGYEAYTWGGQSFKIMTPEQEGAIKDEVKKSPSFNEAFGDAMKRLGPGKTFEWTNPNTGETKTYKTEYASNKNVPFDGSKSASNEDAAALAVANNKLSFVGPDGKVYAVDFKQAKTILETQNQSQAETNRLLRQAIKPATDESMAETQRLMSSGKPGVTDQVSTVLANTLSTTTQGLGKLVQSFADSYSLATGEALGNSVYKAGQVLEAYGKENQVYGADVQAERMAQVQKLASEADNEFDRWKILAQGAAKYPIGFWGEVGKELGQEAPTVITGLAAGAALVAGAPALAVAGAVKAAATFFEAAEVFGSEGAAVERSLLAKGVSAEKARDAALMQGTFSAAITIPTEYLANKALVDVWFKGVKDATIGTVIARGGSAVGAQAAAEMMQTLPTTLSAQYLVNGKTDMNAALAGTYYAAMISAGTTGAIVAPTSIRDSAVVAKDAAGNNVTWKEFTSGTKIADLKTLDLSAQIGQSNDGDAITLGTLTAAPVGGLPSYEFLKDVLPSSVTNQNYIVGSDALGDPVTLDMLTNQVTSNADYDKVFNSLLTTTPQQRNEAQYDFLQTVLLNSGYKPTEQEVRALITDSPAGKEAIKNQAEAYADPRVVVEQEVKDAYAALGLNKPTQADILKLVGQYEETGLTGKATENLESAKYNSLLEQIEQLGTQSGIDPAALEAIKSDLNTQITALGGDVSKLQAGLDSVVSGQAAADARLTDLQKNLSDEIKAARDIGLEGDAAIQAGLDSLAGKVGTNQADLLAQLGTTAADLKAQFATDIAASQTATAQEIANTKAALETAIADAKASGLQGDAALKSAIDAVAASQQTSAADLLDKLGTTESALRTEFATGITGLEAQMKAQYDALTAAQKAEADARLAQGQTLEQAIAAAQATTAGQISNLEAQTTEQYNTLTEAQKATADALVAQGKTLADAIEAAKTETSGQIADVETRLTDAIAAAEAMGLTRDQAITAAVESVAADLGTTKADLLTQLGTTEAALRTEFTTGLAGVSAEVKAAYDSLSADQKALANQLTQQGTDLATAIQQAQQQTQGQIGALSADMQAKYDALTAEQKALANDMAQQGMDLNAAINLAQQQTQAQITGLGQQVDARINELMQQGQTYQEATRQAIGELNQQNQQLQGLVGTQGRQATQADIDAMSQMLGGQRAMDLTYDVTGDKQVTQADIDFLSQVVSGVKTDYTPPVGSFLGPTGLYGELATMEAKRQADLQAQSLREQEAAAAAAEAQRRGKISATLAQGQQGLRQISQQLPQAFQQAQQVSTPIYGQMGEYLDIGSPLDFDFFKPSPEKQAATKQQQPTKIAAGGYIDDLLAGDMTADDLLNLLR